MVPLVLVETAAAWARATLEVDQAMSVWWATEVECVSAIARLERGGELSPQAALEALQQLEDLTGEWHEVQPTQSIRVTARRLLRVHNLRAADSLQLAAAIVAAGGYTASLEFVTLDDRLVDAARREGFQVLRFAGQ